MGRCGPQQPQFTQPGGLRPLHHTLVARVDGLIKAWCGIVGQATCRALSGGGYRSPGWRRL